MHGKNGGALTSTSSRRGSPNKSLVAILACIVLAGCGTESVRQGQPASFDEQIASAIKDAAAGGASDAQLAILRQAQSEGEMSLEGARRAVRSGVACINAMGLPAFYVERTEQSGLARPEYVVQVDGIESADATAAIIDECDFEELFWVDKVYQDQPTSQAVKDAYLDQQAPLVRSCLERNGYSTDPDATTRELLIQAHDVVNETSFAIDCFAEAEIGSF